MKFSEKLKELLSSIFPFLKELLSEKIIPSAIQKGYEAFDTFADEKIESLAAQVDKYESALTEDKRETYRKGIELGIKALRLVADKLNTAADEFMKAVA